ncbi:MAG: type II secretion system protein GspN [Proteobacteria bacterium]|nr:type II secretion system protein GspN [Pseudomonadota bacterium]
MRRKFLSIIGVIALFIVVFIVSIFLMLPTEAIRHYIEKTLEKQLKYEQTVEIGDLSISPLLNATVKDFQMKPRNAEAVDEKFATAGGEFNGFWCAPYVEDQAVIIDKIVVKPKIFKSIKGKPEGKFELQIQDGTITGDLKSQNGNMEVTAEATDISMNEFALLSNLTKMQIYGMLNFELRTVLEKSKMAELQLDMTAANTAMCPKRIKLNMGGVPYIEVPFTVFGNIKANVEIKKNRVYIHSLTSDGPDISLNVTGEMGLKTKDTPFPQIDIRADIFPSEEWVTENNMKAIYQLCEKHDDGSIHLEVTGTTKKPKMDCGTPIPEPVAEVPAPAKKDDAKGAENKGDDKKKDARKKTEPEKSAPETATVLEEDAQKARELQAGDSKPPERPEDGSRFERRRMDGARPERPPFDGEGGERPRPQFGSGRRPAPDGRGDPGMRRDFEGMNLRGTDKLDENIAREIGRRGRGRRARPEGDENN